MFAASGERGVNQKLAFYAIKQAVERSLPELAGSIQGRQELDRMAHEILTAITEAGLCLTHVREAPPVRSPAELQRLS